MIKKMLILLTLLTMLTSFFTVLPVFADEGSDTINYPELTINNAKWYTEIRNGFGFVYLHIAGHVNVSADKITILIHGDGLNAEQEIKIDENKNFDQTSEIRFTHAPNGTPFTASTEISVYINQSKTSYKINSGELRYDIAKSTYRICGYISPNCDFNKDSEQHLLQGYNIELLGTGRNVTTGENGYFEISEFANGTYTLKITKNGCLSKIIPNVVIKDGDVYISGTSSPIETYIGDINGDNAINMSDVMKVASVFNCKYDASIYNTIFDLNVDGVINMGDIMILAKNFNKVGDQDGLIELTPTPTLTSTPVPTYTYANTASPTPTNDYIVNLTYANITRDYVYTPSTGFEKIDQYGPGEVGYYIIVFSGPIYDSMKSDAENAGAKLYSYLPQYSFLAAITTEDVEKVKSLPCVLDVIVFQNEYKVIDRTLLGNYSGEVIVGFFDTSDGIYDFAQKIGGVVVKDVWDSGDFQAALLQIDKGKVYELCKYPQIRFIQKNYEYTLNAGL